MLKLRWVHWYPAPYWNARFTALANHPNIDFRVYFLSRRNPEHTWQFSPDSFQFPHTFVATLFPMREPQAERKLGLPLWALKERDATVVIPYSEVDLLLALLIRRLIGGRTFACTDNTVFDDRSHSAFNETLKRLAFRAVNGVLAGGPFQREYVSGYVRDLLKVKELFNPVDNSWYIEQHLRLQEIRPALRGEMKLCGPTFLYTGRLHNEKSVDILIRAFAKLLNVCPTAHLLIAGAGPEEDTLHTLATTIHGDIRFLGYQSQDELVKLYEVCDVFVLPSKTEPWGVVVNEAMLFEKPVIVSDRVGARALLIRDGYNGYSFPWGDINALSDLLARLAQNPELAADMGKHSFSIISQYGIESWVERVQGAIESA